jgi:hypothetical protein
MNWGEFLDYGAVGMFVAFLALIGVVTARLAPIAQKLIELVGNHMSDLSKIIQESLGSMTDSLNNLKDSIDGLREDTQKWRDKEGPPTV